MSSTMGKGTVFASIPVFVLEGGMTLPAKLLSPVMTADALSHLSPIGPVPICCIDVDLIVGQKIAVADMLPAVLPAAAAACLPWPF